MSFATPVFHGSMNVVNEFNRPAHGVFFTPHIDQAEVYGNIITIAKLISNNVYIVNFENKEFDNQILDALFDMDYIKLAELIKILESKGYNALQTQTDSEMICAFNSTSIVILDNIDVTKECD